MRQQQIALLMWWIFGALVTPIIRCCFYVTETQPLKFATVYYRKPTWRTLEAGALGSLTTTIYRVRRFGNVPRLYYLDQRATAKHPCSYRPGR